MKDFFKENGKTIRKIYVNQFGAVIFALMMVLATLRISSAAVDILSSVITIFFYAYLLYLVAWEKGAQDRIKVDGGKKASCQHLGVKIAAAAVAPTVLLCVLWFICYILGAYAGISIFAAVGSVLAIVVFVLQATFSQLINLLTVGMPKVILPAVYIVSTLPVIFVFWLSYYFGYHGKFMSVAYKRDPQ